MHIPDGDGVDCIWIGNGDFVSSSKFNIRLNNYITITYLAAQYPL